MKSVKSDEFNSIKYNFTAPNSDEEKSGKPYSVRDHYLLENGTGVYGDVLYV